MRGVISNARAILGALLCLQIEILRGGYEISLPRSGAPRCWLGTRDWGWTLCHLTLGNTGVDEKTKTDPGILLGRGSLLVQA